MPIMQVNGSTQASGTSKQPTAKEAGNKGDFADVLESSLQGISQDLQKIQSNGQEKLQQDVKKIDLKDLQKLLLSLEELLGNSNAKETSGSAMDETQVMLALQQLYQSLQPLNQQLTGNVSSQATANPSVIQFGTAPQLSANEVVKALTEMLSGLQATNKGSFNSTLTRQIAGVIKGLSDLANANPPEDIVIPQQMKAGNSKAAADLAINGIVNQEAKQSGSNTTAITSTVNQTKQAAYADQAAVEDGSMNPTIQASGPYKKDDLSVQHLQANQSLDAQKTAILQVQNPQANESLDVQKAAFHQLQNPQANEDKDVAKVAFYQLQNPPIAGTNNETLLKKENLPLVPSRFFVKEMQVVITNQVRLNSGTGAYEATLRLFPENLGRVDVKISALNGQITAQFLTNSNAGKEVVERQLEQLKNALINQGLEVNKLEVVQNTTTPSDQSNNQSNGSFGDQQKNSGSQQQESHNKEEQPAKNFIEDLRIAADEGESPDNLTDLDGMDMTA